MNNIESYQRSKLDSVVAFISSLSRFLNKLSQILLSLLDPTLIVSLKTLNYVVPHATDFHLLKNLAICYI